MQPEICWYFLMETQMSSIWEADDILNTCHASVKSVVIVFSLEHSFFQNSKQVLMDANQSISTNIVGRQSVNDICIWNFMDILWLTPIKIYFVATATSMILCLLSNTITIKFWQDFCTYLCTWAKFTLTKKSYSIAPMIMEYMSRIYYY